MYVYILIDIWQNVHAKFYVKISGLNISVKSYFFGSHSFISSPCECEHLASVVLTFHILIFSSETP